MFSRELGRGVTYNFSIAQGINATSSSAAEEDSGVVVVEDATASEGDNHPCVVIKVVDRTATCESLLVCGD